MLPASVDEDLLSTLHPSPPDSALFDYTGDPHDYDRAYNFGAEAAARELEETFLGPRQRSGRKDPSKRPANGGLSDASSDPDLSIVRGRKDRPVNKKRRLEYDALAIAEEFERTVNDLSVSPSKATKSKGKGKVSHLREQSVESTATSSFTPKGRKKSAARKKHDGLHGDGIGQSGLGSAAGSLAGDATPSASRPASPALTVSSTVVYELDEVVPPLRRAKKVDDNAMAKRLKSLEEAQRKVWTNIAKRDITKVYKHVCMNDSSDVSPGIQVCCHGLSSQTKSGQTTCYAILHASPPTVHTHCKSQQRRASESETSYARDACFLEKE